MDAFVSDLIKGFERRLTHLEERIIRSLQKEIDKLKSNIQENVGNGPQGYYPPKGAGDCPWRLAAQRKYLWVTDVSTSL